MPPFYLHRVFLQADPANALPHAMSPASDLSITDTFLIARFMGPTWVPSVADRTQVGPMLVPWTLLSGTIDFLKLHVDGLAQDCSNSSALAMELPQSCAKCAKPLIWYFSANIWIYSLNFVGWHHCSKQLHFDAMLRGELRVVAYQSTSIKPAFLATTCWFNYLVPYTDLGSQEYLGI